MRLSEEKIKQGILHPKPYVRDAAISYFSAAFTEDRHVMMTAAEAIQRFGPREAFADVDSLQSLAQGDASVDWIAGEMWRIGAPSEVWQSEYLTSLSWIVAHADAGLLKRLRKDILGLPYLDSDARAMIETKTRLLSKSPESCWQEFEHCCEALAMPDSKSTGTLARAYEFLDAVAHHRDAGVGAVLALLADQNIDKQSDLKRAWMQACVIRAAAQMRLPEAAPHLIRMLQENHETWIYDDCVLGLIRIGGEPVVKGVWNACVMAQGNFLQYATWVLEAVHADLSVEACRHLFEQSSDAETKLGFAYAMIAQFDVDSVATVRNFLKELSPSEQTSDLRDAWGAVCTLLEVDYPEVLTWREAVEAELEASPELASWPTEFPVVDTWSPQAVQPQERKLRTKPLPPIRLPKLYNAGRNEPCPCASGKKYKNCCMRR